MITDEIAEEVRRLELATRRLVRDLSAGDYASAFRGRGIEFQDVREYQPGDDVRTIDWRVTARLGVTYLRRHHEERELTMLLLVDESASAQVGSRRRTRSELAAQVAAVLALTAAHANDRVGAAFFSDGLGRMVPPKKGRRHALRVLGELLAARAERSHHRPRRCARFARAAPAASRGAGHSLRFLHLGLPAAADAPRAEARDHLHAAPRLDRAGASRRRAAPAARSRERHPGHRGRLECRRARLGRGAPRTVRGDARSRHLREWR